MRPEATIRIHGVVVPVGEARVLLGVPDGECFGCFLGDAAPELHDQFNDGCEYQDGWIVTLPPA